MTQRRIPDGEHRAIHWAIATSFADHVLTGFAPVDAPGTITYQACRDVLRILAYLTCQARPGRLDNLPPGAVLVRALDPTAPTHIVRELGRCGHVLDSNGLDSAGLDSAGLDSATADPVASAWSWLQEHEQHDLAGTPELTPDPESNYQRGLRTSVELLDRVLLHRQGGWATGTPIRVHGGEHDGDVGGILSPIWGIADSADDPWNVAKQPPTAYRVWLLTATTEIELAPDRFHHRHGRSVPAPTPMWGTKPPGGGWPVEPHEPR
ncbi:MAG: hypothetical protein QOF58_1932 [Pseudonocardiales bacterium]|nr:hypothetical protein [Pseudonocardiales bacterium]